MMNAMKIMETIMEILKRQPKMEFEDEMMEDAKEKLADWIANAVVDAYEQGLKDGAKL